MDVQTPVAETPVALTLNALSTEQNREWRLTGKLPDPEKVAYPPTAEPAPDPIAVTPTAEVVTPPSPVVPAVSTETKATDSEAVKAKTKARFDELLAERAAEKIRADAAERRLRELEGKPTPKQDAKPDSSPAKAKFPTYETWKADNPNADPDDYIDARVEFREQQREAERTARVEYETRAKTIESTVTQFSERLKADVGDVAAFVNALPPLLGDLKPTWNLAEGESVKPHNIVANEVLRSPNPGKLLTFLRDNDKEFLGILKAGDAPDIVRAMGRLEAKLEADAVPPKPKTVSSAPKPAMTLGTKPSEALDEAQLALERKDFTAYRRIQNARDMAKRTA